MESLNPLDVSALGGLTALRLLEICGTPMHAGFELCVDTPGAGALAGLSALTRLERLHLRGLHSMAEHALNIDRLQRLTVGAPLTVCLLGDFLCMSLSKQYGLLTLCLCVHASRGCTYRSAPWPA